MKWHETFAVLDQEAMQAILRLLVCEFVCHYGAPLEIHLDHAGEKF